MNTNRDELSIAADLFKNRNYLPAAKCYANVADLLEKAGNYKEAELIFHNIIECYKKEAEKNINEENYHDAAEILLAAGELENRLNEEQLSKKYYQMAVQQFINAAKKSLEQKDYQTAGDNYKKAAIYLEKEILDKNGAIKVYQDAINCYQELINQNINEKDYKRAAQFTQFTAILYEKVGNCGKAIEVNKKALGLAKKHNFIQIVTDCYQHIAYCLYILDKKEEILKTLQIAKDYIIKIGKSNMKNEEFLEAAERFDNVISILEDMLKYSKKKENILGELTLIYIDKAECYLKFAENLFKLDEFERAAHFQRNAAICYKIINDNEKAAELFLDAAKSFEELGDKKLASINYRDAGFQYEILKNPETAANLLFKAGELAKFEDYTEISIECFRATLKNCECFEEKEKFQIAFEEFKNCIEILVKEEELEGNFHIVAAYFSEIGNYYENMGNLDAADEYYLKATKNLQNAVKIAIADEQLPIAAYSLSCLTILSLILNDIKSVEANLNIFKNKLEKSRYFGFSKDLLKVYTSKNQDLTKFIEKYEYLIKHSDELDYLITILKERIKNK